MHTFRLVDADGRVDLREVPLAPQARPAVHGVGRGGEDRRRRPRLPPPRPVEAIERGAFPEWELGVQLFTQEQADELPLRPSSTPTKLIPEELVPLRIVGRMVLDRKPDNFFAETEQVAFCAAQRRARHRLHQRPAAAGPPVLLPRHPAPAAGLAQLPRAPDQRAQVARSRNYQRDGHMQMTAAHRPRRLRAQLAGAATARARGPRQAASHSAAVAEAGDKGRIRARELRRPLQPGAAVLPQPDAARAARTSPRRWCSSCPRSSTPARARSRGRPPAPSSTRTWPHGVSAGLGLRSLPEAPRPASPVVDLPLVAGAAAHRQGEAHLQDRQIGILVADGSDAAAVRAISAAAQAAGATVKVVAPKVGGATLADGKLLEADGQLAGTPSVLFDAVAVILSPQGAAQLGADSAALQFVSDAFAHLKAIAVDAGGRALLGKTAVQPDAGVVDAGGHRGVPHRRQDAPVGPRAPGAQPRLSVWGAAAGRGTPRRRAPPASPSTARSGIADRSSQGVRTPGRDGASPEGERSMTDSPASSVTASPRRCARARRGDGARRCSPRHSYWCSAPRCSPRPAAPRRRRAPAAALRPLRPPRLPRPRRPPLRPPPRRRARRHPHPRRPRPRPRPHAVGVALRRRRPHRRAARRPARRLQLPEPRAAAAPVERHQVR